MSATENVRRRILHWNFVLRPLELENHNCPAELWPAVQEHAERIIARRGEQFQISTSGQTTTLGG